MTLESSRQVTHYVCTRRNINAVFSIEARFLLFDCHDSRFMMAQSDSSLVFMALLYFLPSLYNIYSPTQTHLKAQLGE